MSQKLILTIIFIILSTHILLSQSCGYDPNLCYNKIHYPQIPFAIEKKWESFDTVGYGPIFFKDINNDCFPELFTLNKFNKSCDQISIINIKKNKKIYSIKIPLIHNFTISQFAIADIFTNNKPGLIIAINEFSTSA